MISHVKPPVPETCKKAKNAVETVKPSLMAKVARVNWRKAELIECEYEQDISKRANTNWVKEEVNSAKYN